MFFLSNENLSLASNIYFDGIQNYTFLYSITSEQTRRFIDWKIRREREKFFDRDSLREIYLGGKLENVTREEENCTGVKYYPGILARTTEQFTCTSLQLGEVTNTPPKLSV